MTFLMATLCIISWGATSSMVTLYARQSPTVGCVICRLALLASTGKGRRKEGWITTLFFFVRREEKTRNKASPFPVFFRRRNRRKLSEKGRHSNGGVLFHFAVHVVRTTDWLFPTFAASKKWQNYFGVAFQGGAFGGNGGLNFGNMTCVRCVGSTEWQVEKILKFGKAREDLNYSYTTWQKIIE